MKRLSDKEFSWLLRDQKHLISEFILCYVVRGEGTEDWQQNRNMTQTLDRVKESGSNKKNFRGPIWQRFRFHFYYLTMWQDFLLTLPCEHCYRNSWVTELDERPSFIDIHPVSGQQDVLGTNKAMDQLFVLLKHPRIEQLC